MTTETMERPSTEILEYSQTAAALADLRARLGGVAYDLSTIKGLDVAKKDRAEVRGLRVALEAKRVELKAPALERSRLIDAEAKALTAELVAIEKPIDDQIKAEERRKEAEKVAKENAEREAAALVSKRIEDVRRVAFQAAGMNSGGIALLISGLQKIEITLAEYGDRSGEALQAKAETLAKLEEMHAAAKAQEIETARIAAEREELNRLRAEQEVREKAERERIAADQKAAADKLATERAAFDRQQAEAHADAKRRDDADRARRDEEDRLAREARAAEDKRLSDTRVALEAEQRALREAEEVKATEKRKAEQAAADLAAAKERKRLDKIAADKRAAELAELEAMQAEANQSNRIRDAAPVMLEALQNLENDAGQIPATAWSMVCAAITLATGKTK